MKKAKNITIGAKVFAKVKGYPAWPAKVAEDLGGGKKFKVIFYGTGETGIVKPEDIFSYGDHKDQFVKNLKRKDYNEAVEEIEAAIAAEASGATLPKQEEVEISDVELDDEPPVSRGQKRKLSVDSSSGSEVKKKAPSKTESRRSSHTPSASSKVAQDTLDQDRADEEEEDEPDEPEDELEDEDEDEENEEEEDEDEEEEEASGNNNRKSKAGNEESSEEDPDEVEEVKEPTKFVIIPPYDLQELIDDFEDSKSETRVNTDKPEPGMMAQNEILLARLNPDQYIGIKLNQNPPQKFDTESDQLRWKADDYRRALELKDKIESGAMKPEDNPDLFELELELTEEQRQEAIKTRIMERKRMKLKYLRVEANMVELDANIKQYLSIEKADPIAAIKELDLMMALNLTKLMVKKHSHVMEMVKRLRRYVGNVKSWNFSDEELVEFNKNSEIIRNKAEILYNKLQSLFSVPDDSTFAEVYVSELEKFKSQTKAMTESQVFLLCAEPGSKEAILDNDIEQEEIELVAAKNQKKEKKKQPIES